MAFDMEAGRRPFQLGHGFFKKAKTMPGVTPNSSNCCSYKYDQSISRFFFLLTFGGILLFGPGHDFLKRPKLMPAGVTPNVYIQRICKR